MKLKIYLLFAFIACSIYSFGQTEKYYRIKIPLSTTRQLQKIASLGIATDEGEYVPGNYFMSDMSESELAAIKKAGVSYEVVISDLSSYYQNRNLESDQEKEAGIPPECSYAIPANFKLGTMGGFLTYDAMLSTLDSMRKKYPTLISIKQAVSSTMTSIEGRTIYYVRISNQPDADQNKSRVLYTGLHHAREPISMQHLIFYMWYLLENYNSDPSVKSLVDNLELYFIPCVNPDGYIYNQTTNPNGGGLWRKNRRNNGDGTFGVDLNRNYSYKWGYDNIGSSNVTSSDTYRGTAGFSEPETQIVRDFCIQKDFYLVMNNHSYANALIYPYGYRVNYTTPDQPTFKTYSDSLTKCNMFVSGTANQTVGYTANGTSDDWMYGDQTSKPKEFAFTPESSSSSDGFWPKKSRITTLCRKNMDMNLQAAKLTLTNGQTLLDFIANVPDSYEAVTIFQNAPNPASNQTFIKYQIQDNASANLQLSVLNILGVVVRQIPIDPNQLSTSLNVNDLDPGLYYYYIGNNSKKSDVRKMSIIK